MGTRDLYGAVAIVASLGIVGCSASGPLPNVRNIRTYEALVASAPPTGMVRIVPQPPTLTRTKARYEWQVVCDRSFSRITSTGMNTVLSGGMPVDRLAGDLPTVTTFYIEVTTTPHGDGSMGLSVSQGQTEAATRPLFDASAASGSGTTGGMGLGDDGQKEAPAASFVHPTVVAPTLQALPATIEFARIDVPGPRFGTVEAVRYGGKGGPVVGYRERFLLDVKGDLPHRFGPKVEALQKRGYQVQGSLGAPARHETFSLTVKP